MTSYKWINDTFLNGEVPREGGLYRDSIGNNGVRERMLTSAFPMDALRFASGPTLLIGEAGEAPGTENVPYHSLITRTFKIEKMYDGTELLLTWGEWCADQVKDEIEPADMKVLWDDSRVPLHAAKFAAWGSTRVFADQPLAFSSMRRLQRDHMLELVGEL